MYQTILDFDFAILEFMNFMRNSILDPIMIFVSSLGDKGILWIACGVVLLFFSKTRKAGICLLVALLINLLIVNVTIKPLVARHRPFEAKEGIRLIVDAPHDRSFPSGHTSASFAAAVSIFMYNRKWGSIAIALACAIAISRLYLYVHFPTDVIFGALFGIFAAFVSKRTVDKLPPLY